MQNNGQNLPFITSGGTSIWMTCLALGIVLSVSAREDKKQKKEKDSKKEENKEKISESEQKSSISEEEDIENVTENE